MVSCEFLIIRYGAYIFGPPCTVCGCICRRKTDRRARQAVALRQRWHRRTGNEMRWRHEGRGFAGRVQFRCRVVHGQRAAGDQRGRVSAVAGRRRPAAAADDRDPARDRRGHVGDRRRPAGDRVTASAVARLSLNRAPLLNHRRLPASTAAADFRARLNHCATGDVTARRWRHRKRRRYDGCVASLLIAHNFYRCNTPAYIPDKTIPPWYRPAYAKLRVNVRVNPYPKLAPTCTLSGPNFYMRV